MGVHSDIGFGVGGGGYAVGELEAEGTIVSGVPARENVSDGGVQSQRAVSERDTERHCCIKRIKPVIIRLKDTQRTKHAHRRIRRHVGHHHDSHPRPTNQNH